MVQSRLLGVGVRDKLQEAEESLAKWSILICTFHGILLRQ